MEGRKHFFLLIAYEQINVCHIFTFIVPTLQVTIFRDTFNSGSEYQGEKSLIQPKVGGVVGCSEGVVYLTSPGRPTDIGL